MVKRIIILLGMFFIMLSATGCARIQYDVNVKSNGKVDINFVYAVMEVNELLPGESNNQIDNEIVASFEKRGWTSREYNVDNYNGYVFSKNNIKIQDLIKELQENEESINEEESVDIFNNITKSVTVNKSNMNLVFQLNVLNDEEIEKVSVVAEYMKAYNGFAKVKLTLPFAPDNSNATSISNNGKTLEWDLADIKNGNIRIELSLIKIAVIVLVVISFVYYLCSKKKKKTKKKVNKFNGKYNYAANMNYKYQYNNQYNRYNNGYNYGYNNRYF